MDQRSRHPGRRTRARRGPGHRGTDRAREGDASATGISAVVSWDPSTDNHRQHRRDRIPGKATYPKCVNDRTGYPESWRRPGVPRTTFRLFRGS
ncbi:hypothetical protein [Streptomyces sp. NPDC056672]|uniref:hypothetical protein n=1 Tax=Streptomyces sp. NPDC056672 TaxID=3345906 RepID=UPI0036C2550F